MEPDAYSHHEHGPDMVVRAYVVDKAHSNGDAVTPHLLEMDYSTTAYRVLRAFEERLLKFGLPAEELRLTNDLFTSMSKRSGSGLAVFSTNTWEFIEPLGLALADRDVILRRIGRLTKDELDILLLPGETAPKRLTATAVRKRIFAPNHSVALAAGEDWSVRLVLEGHTSHRPFVMSFDDDLPIRVTPAQIRELGCILPKLNSVPEGTDTSATVVTITPDLPDDKFCRVRSQGHSSGTEVTHNLRAKTDPSQTLTVADLQAATWRLTVEDREKKKDADDDPLNPLDTQQG